MLDVRVWSLMLLMQGIPYAAAGLVSLISAAPRLPGWLIGPMRASQPSSADGGRPRALLIVVVLLDVLLDIPGAAHALGKVIRSPRLKLWGSPPSGVTVNLPRRM